MFRPRGHRFLLACSTFIDTITRPGMVSLLSLRKIGKRYRGVRQHEIQGHDGIFLPGERRTRLPHRIDDVDSKAAMLQEGTEQ